MTPIQNLLIGINDSWRDLKDAIDANPVGALQHYEWLQDMERRIATVLSMLENHAAKQSRITLTKHFEERVQ
jgi:hypothetical protein